MISNHVLVADYFRMDELKSYHLLFYVENVIRPKIAYLKKRERERGEIAYLKSHTLYFPVHSERKLSAAALQKLKLCCHLASLGKTLSFARKEILFQSIVMLYEVFSMLYMTSIALQG